MILKQGHKYEPMPHDGKVIRRIYRGGRCYYIATPYSPEATQALKAAFPQYWTAIRDYGWANPALVPFVNEYVPIDVDVLYSLIPSMNKIRAMVTSNSKNYIDLGIIPDSETIFEAEFMYPNTVYWAAVGGIRASTGKNAGNFYLAATGAKNMTIAVGSAYYASGTFATLNTIQTSFNRVRISGKGVWINDTNITSFESAISTTNTIRMFRHFPTGNDGKVGMTISNVWVNHDGKDYWYIPVMIDGVAELVDVYSLQLATRSGSFTIQITDKA